MIIRPIEQKDCEQFINFAFHTGQGMSSMPQNRETLEQTVQHAVNSFKRQINSPGNEHYLFVLEDPKTGILGGTCGITAKVGLSEPLYFYHQEQMERMNHSIPFLRLVHYFSMPSEIGSLFLSPTLRHHGLGKLLSLSRFLFVADHKERFDRVIFAVMRGFFIENGTCPFWDGIGRHFLNIDFTEVMDLQANKKLDVASLLPTYPIFLELLPKIVQENTGKVHHDSLSALNMLIQEGFQLTKDIDALDGGPKIEAETTEIRTIKESHFATVEEISTNILEGNNYLVSNGRLQFRATLAPIQIKNSSRVIISKETAENLQVEKDDTIRYVSLI